MITRTKRPKRGFTLTEEHKRKISESNKKAKPATFYDYECQSCSKKFEARQRNRKYCSQECYHKSMFQLICQNCFSEFYGGAPNRKYCDNCLTKECEQCGESFELTSGELQDGHYNGPRKFCSQECYHESTIGTPAWNKDYIELQCQNCDEIFEVPRGRKDTAKYCSWNCFKEGKSKITGPNHPLWKGGHNEYGRKLSLNEGSFYRNRRKVLQRDSNTCRYCGHEGESSYMDVHHIIPVREGGPNTLDNLITLCRKCHNQADNDGIDQELLFVFAKQPDRTLFRTK